MKTFRKTALRALPSAILALVLLLAGTAGAKPEKLDIKIGQKTYQVESDDVRQGDIHIARGDTFNDDLVARGGSVVVDGVVAGDCVAYGGALIINGQVRKDAVAFGGSVTINDSGTVQGDLASFGGPITMLGTVNGEIASFGGRVSLGPSSVVDGDISVIGGQVDRAEGATVRGEIKNIDLGMINNFIPQAVNVSQRKPVLGRIASFILPFVWAAAVALLLLLTVLFFPASVARVADAAEIDIWKSIGLGLVGQLAFFPALVLLVISILGIILIPLAVLLFLAAIILGFAGFSLLVARRLFQASPRPAPGRLALTLIGCGLLFVLIIGGSLINLLGSPFHIIGWILIIADLIILWFAATVGLGAVWTTRMGSREETARVVSA